MNMELRHLQYFVAVAESEHVTRAAERLHVSQPPVSRAIRELEAQLGVALFAREKQRLRLTQEGRALLEDARAALAASRRFTAHARAVALGDAGKLRVGYIDGAMQSGILGGHLRKYRRGSPNVGVELVALRSGEQLAALRNAEIDIAMLYTPDLDDDSIVARKLLSDDLLLISATDDPLARRRVISPADLHGKPWVALPRSVNSLWRERFLQWCADAGFVPDVHYETTQLSTVLGLVEAGVGLAFAQASAARLNYPGVRFRRLPWWRHTVDIWLAWRSPPCSPMVERFLSANGIEH